MEILQHTVQKARMEAVGKAKELYGGWQIIGPITKRTSKISMLSGAQRTRDDNIEESGHSYTCKCCTGVKQQNPF
jgi:hypothetical protein